MAEDRFLFLSGLTWLDLVNTRPVLEGKRVDLLATPDDVRAWIRHVDNSLGTQDFSPARSHSGRALRGDVMEIRDRLETQARRAAAGRPSTPDFKTWVSERLGAIPGTLQLHREKKANSTAIVFVPERHSPAASLFPVIRSAADWLAAGERPWIKACGNPECVLYFTDATKSGTRRWCSAASCGNRSRVAAFRKRRHSVD